MTINNYIRQRFQTFGIQLSEADLFDIAMSSQKSGEDEIGLDNRDAVRYGIAEFIPSLLLRATSISESGFSMSWNIEGVKEYYSMLCKELGIKDKLNQKPKVTFL